MDKERARIRPRAASTAVAAIAATGILVGAAGAASASEPVSRATPWPEDKVVAAVPMEDPWVFRGPTDYTVETQPACWNYPDRDDLVVDVSVLARDRYLPAPPNWGAILFGVHDTATITWTNETTGETGHVAQEFPNSNGVIRVDAGAAVIALDIHLRSDHPWLHAVGSTELPVGHSEGATSAVVDMTGKTCLR